MTLSAKEFLRRFVEHVLPKGFEKIRHYGLLGQRHRKGGRRLCRGLLEAATMAMLATIASWPPHRPPRQRRRSLPRRRSAVLAAAARVWRGATFFPPPGPFADRLERRHQSPDRRRARRHRRKGRPWVAARSSGGNRPRARASVVRLVAEAASIGQSMSRPNSPSAARSKPSRRWTKRLPAADEHRLRSTSSRR